MSRINILGLTDKYALKSTHDETRGTLCLQVVDESLDFENPAVVWQATISFSQLEKASRACKNEYFEFL